MGRIVKVLIYALIVCSSAAFLVWLEYFYTSQILPLRKSMKESSAYSGMLTDMRGSSVLGAVGGVNGMPQGHVNSTDLSGVERSRYDLGALRTDAARGNAGAQYLLAMKYKFGDGVAQNSRQAIKWLREASKLEYPHAQYQLAQAYATGDNVAKDAKQALHWFEKAASNGSIAATYHLGMIYYQGHTVPQNSIVAYSLMRTVQKRGDEDQKKQAEIVRKAISVHMSAEQAALAEKMASSMRDPQKLLATIATVTKN